MSGIKKKRYFSHGWSDRKADKEKQPLESATKGYFATCNFSKDDCKRDVLKLLNEYFEKKKGDNTIVPESSSDETKEDTKDVKKAEEEDEDISVSLQKEIRYIKKESSKIFEPVETGVKNIVFIKASTPDHLELGLSIVKDAFETKKQKSRFILRFLPIELVCKAYIDIIKSKADLVFDKYFVQEPKTFGIIFNRHSNNSIQRNDVIECLAELIGKKNPENKVDLKTPELTVVVEIIRSFCLLAVLPNYFLYKKYNLFELCGPENNKEKIGDTSEDGDIKNEEKEEQVEKKENNSSNEEEADCVDNNEDAAQKL